MQLQRNFEVNQAIYISLENKRQEFSILKASTVGNVTILDDAAVLPNKIYPNNGRNNILGIILGLFFSFTFVLIRYYLSYGLNSPQPLTDNGYMVLATIPKSEIEEEIDNQKKPKKIKYKNIPLLAINHPADLTIEGLRSLRTSLHFSMLDAKDNIVMVTSANPNAGKISSINIVGLSDKNFKEAPSLIFDAPTAKDIDGALLTSNVTAR